MRRYRAFFFCHVGRLQRRAILCQVCDRYYGRFTTALLVFAFADEFFFRADFVVGGRVFVFAIARARPRGHSVRLEFHTAVGRAAFFV